MDQRTLRNLQNSLPINGVVDISKLAEHREKEEWYKGRAKAAGKAEEVITIARSLVVEHPDYGVDKAFELACEFHTKAYAKVEELMKGFKEEDEPGKSDLL